MVQVAILAVLILIAVILAPWLLGLAAIGVAAYGVLLVVVFAFAVAGAVGAIAWLIVRQRFKLKATDHPNISGPRKACRGCQAEIPDTAVWCPHCNTEN